MASVVAINDGQSDTDLLAAKEKLKSLTVCADAHICWLFYAISIKSLLLLLLFLTTMVSYLNGVIHSFFLSILTDLDTILWDLTIPYHTGQAVWNSRILWKSQNNPLRPHHQSQIRSVCAWNAGIYRGDSLIWIWISLGRSFSSMAVGLYG